MPVVGKIEVAGEPVSPGDGHLRPTSAIAPNVYLTGGTFGTRAAVSQLKRCPYFLHPPCLSGRPARPPDPCNVATLCNPSRGGSSRSRHLLIHQSTFADGGEQTGGRVSSNQLP